MATIHRNLTGADLHEPKGADTALSGQVYVSNGAGSGSWLDASTIIANSAFTTGDTKITFKTTADTGWIMGAQGSIGDGSSSATIRANADVENLFLLFWNNFSNALAPVSGGRGISAAADWASHKRLTLPELWGRALGFAGAGTGLTSRSFGAVTGNETVTLAANQIPSITSTVTASGSVSGTTTAHVVTLTSSTTGGGAFGFNPVASLSGGAISGSASVTGTATSNNTGSTAVNMMQPTVFLNIMIKL